LFNLDEESKENDLKMDIEDVINTTHAEKAINEIKQIFFGKIEQIITYEIGSTKKENINEDEYKYLYLHPKDKDLYSAWDSMFQSPVEDYKPDGIPADNAIKQRWIVELPKVLFFLITRVYYDKEKKIFIKDNEPFDFEDVIYPDRYLLQNRKISDQLRNQVNELRAKTNRLQDHIAKFKNYNEKKHDIGAILHSTIHLLKSNAESMDSDMSSDGITLFSPEKL